jgi:Popeye protein conserved region
MGPLSGQTAAEILTHISCALSFGAFLVRDMLWLRFLAIGSSLVWIAAMAANNWITASFFWNGVVIAINTYNIGVLLNENRSVSFTDEERELYETLFRSFRPGEFLKVIRIAKWEECEARRATLAGGRFRGWRGVDYGRIA